MATLQIDVHVIAAMAERLYGRVTLERRPARADERADAPGGLVIESPAEAAVREAGNILSESLASLEPLAARINAEMEARRPVLQVARSPIPPGVVPKGTPS